MRRDTITTTTTQVGTVIETREDLEALPVGTSLGSYDGEFIVTEDGLMEDRAEEYTFAYAAREYLPLKVRTVVTKDEYTVVGKGADAKVGDLVRILPGQSIGFHKVGNVLTVHQTNIGALGGTQRHTVERPEGGRYNLLVNRFEIVTKGIKAEVGGIIEATQAVAGMDKGVHYKVTAVHASGSITVSLGYAERVIYPSEFKVISAARKPKYAAGTTLYVIEGKNKNAQAGSEAEVVKDYFEGDEFVNVRWVNIVAKPGASALGKQQSNGDYYPEDFSTEKPVPVPEKGEVEVGAWVADKDALDALPDNSAILPVSPSEPFPAVKKNGKWHMQHSTGSSDVTWWVTGTGLRGKAHESGLQGFLLLHYGSGR